MPSDTVVSGPDCAAAVSGGATTYVGGVYGAAPVADTNPVTGADTAELAGLGLEVETAMTPMRTNAPTAEATMMPKVLNPLRFFGGCGAWYDTMEPF